MTDRPMAVVFGLVAAIMLVMLILIGVIGKNAAPTKAQSSELPTTSGSQNLEKL